MGRNTDADGLTVNKVCTGIIVLTVLLESFLPFLLFMLTKYLDVVCVMPPDNNF